MYKDNLARSTRCNCNKFSVSAGIKLTQPSLQSRYSLLFTGCATKIMNENKSSPTQHQQSVVASSRSQRTYSHLKLRNDVIYCAINIIITEISTYGQDSIYELLGSFLPRLCYSGSQTIIPSKHSNLTSCYGHGDGSPLFAFNFMRGFTCVARDWNTYT